MSTLFKEGVVVRGSMKLVVVKGEKLGVETTRKPNLESRSSGLMLPRKADRERFGM